MNTTRMREAALDASLDACLHDARSGDTRQARRLHELLDHMLTEREGAEGRFWLTDHGRQVLAEMHRGLSRFPDSDEKIVDLRVSISVANELCEQRESGDEPNMEAAAERVAERGEFGLDASRIRDVYEEVAAAVGGFREISAH
jgi:hypothetical protein